MSNRVNINGWEIEADLNGAFCGRDEPVTFKVERGPVLRHGLQPGTGK